MNRRGLITGLGALFITAPAIVRASSLMPIKAVELYGRSPAMEAVQLVREIQYRFNNLQLYQLEFDRAYAEIGEIMRVPPQWLHA